MTKKDKKKKSNSKGSGSDTFSVSPKLLADAISKLNKMVTEGVDLTLSFSKGSLTLYIESSSKATLASRVIPIKGNPTDIPNCTVDPSILLGICKGTTDLEFTLSSNTLSFTGSSGKYKGNIVTSQTARSSVKVVPKGIYSDENRSEFSSNLRLSLLEALSSVSITDQLFNDKNMDAFVKVSKKSLEVLVCDYYHAAYASSILKKNIASMEAYFPVKYVQYMKDYFSDNASFSIHFSESTMYVWSEDNQLALPLLSSERPYTLEEFKENTSGKDFKPHCSYTFNCMSLVETLTRISSLYKDEEQLVTLKMSSKGVKLSAQSNYGKVDETLEGIKVVSAPKKDASINLEVKTLLDTLRAASKNSPKEPLLFIANDSSLFGIEIIKEDSTRVYITGAYLPEQAA